MGNDQTLICQNKAYRNWKSSEESTIILFVSSLTFVLNVGASLLALIYNDNQNKYSTRLFVLFFIGNGITTVSQIVRHSIQLHHFLSCDTIHFIYTTHQCGIFTSSLALFSLVFTNHFLAKAKVPLNLPRNKKLTLKLVLIMVVAIIIGTTVIILPILWDNVIAFSPSLLTNFTADMLCLTYAIKLKRVSNQLHTVTQRTLETSFAGRVKKSYLMIFPAVVVTSSTRLMFLSVYIINGQRRFSDSVHHGLLRFIYFYYASFVVVVIIFIARGKYLKKVKQSLTAGRSNQIIEIGDTTKRNLSDQRNIRVMYKNHKYTVNN